MLFQPNLDYPYVLHADASDYAVGAVLSQEREGRRMPLAFFSQQLTNSQLNWTVWDKEMYEVVASLQKWAGFINFQPVEIWTDHHALRHWVTESVDTHRPRWKASPLAFDFVSI